MKFCVTLAFWCFVALLPSYSYADDDGTPASRNAARSHYNREDRFIHPVDPIVAYRDAEDVVFMGASYADLPDFIRADIEGALGNCPALVANLSNVDVYTYVSDFIRARGLSPNYLVDFHEFNQDPKNPCASSLTCNDDGCVLLPYNSNGYGQWTRGIPIRNKGWSMGTVADARANGILHPKQSTAVSVFDIMTKCPPNAEESSEEGCHSYRIWTSGGLGIYTPQ